METTSRPLYLFANWKMYLDYEESLALARSLESQRDLPQELALAVFPSALAFAGVQRALAGTTVKTGAQNIHWLDKGGYTGEVSAHMYQGLGAEYALIGHSERRHLCGETNHDVRQKMEAALLSGLAPVLCVGETTQEREAGQETEVVEAQLRAAYEEIAWPAGRPIVIAYEPVWAIGTGMACDAEEAGRMHTMINTFVRALLPEGESSILYGGSVRPENVLEYFRQPHVSGVLVGGASVKPESWNGIVTQIKTLF